MEISNFDYVVIPKNSGLGRCRELARLIANEEIIIQEIRGEDVPFFVESLVKKGKKAIGITGEDLFKEFSLKSKNTKLKIVKREIWNEKEYLFGKPTLCLLGPKEKSLEDMGKNIRICINAKYKELSKKKCINILENEGYRIEKIYASGATEEFYTKGIADMVIDIVCSGKSAEKAGLRVYEKLFESDIVFIGENQEKRFDFKALYDKIKKRIEENAKDSYTSQIARDYLVLNRKLVEEAAEVITAKNREQLIWESADLLYFLFVILVKNGITLDEVEKENARRNLMSKTYLKSEETVKYGSCDILLKEKT